VAHFAPGSVRGFGSERSQRQAADHQLSSHAILLSAGADLRRPPIGPRGYGRTRTRDSLRRETLCSRARNRSRGPSVSDETG
jgi:hypothetical protein